MATLLDSYYSGQGRSPGATRTPQRAVTGSMLDSYQSNVERVLTETRKPAQQIQVVGPKPEAKRGLFDRREDAFISPVPEDQLMVSPKDTRSRKLSLKKMWQSLKGGAKTLPGTLQTAGGIIMDAYFKMSSKAPAYTKFDKKIKEQFVTKGKEKAAEIRAKGTEKRQEKLAEHTQEFEPSAGFQGLLEMAAFNLPQMGVTFGLSAATLAVTKNPVLAKTVGLSTAYGLGASEVYNSAVDYGLSDEEAITMSQLGGVVIGALDFLPLDNLLEGNPAAEEIKKSVIRNISKQLVRVGAQAGFEGITEGAQEIVGNAIAQTYNEHADLLEGVPEAMMVGALMGGVTEVTIGEAMTGEKGIDSNQAQAQINKAINESKDETVKEALDEVSTRQMSPDEAIVYIIRNKQEKTAFGKEIVKVAYEAKQSGSELLLGPTESGNLGVTIVSPDQASLEGSEVDLPLKQTVAESRESALVQEPSLKTSSLPESSSKRYVSPSQIANITDIESSEAKRIIQDYSNKIIDEYQPMKPILDKKLAEATGLKPESRIKKVDSLEGKIHRYFYKKQSVSEIADILAAKVETSIEGINNQIKKIKDSFDTYEVENYFETPTPWGYRGVNIKAKLNGRPVEIQVHTPESWKLAQAMHKLYERWRNKDTENMTDQQKAEMKADRQKSLKLSREIKEKGEYKKVAQGGLGDIKKATRKTSKRASKVARSIEQKAIEQKLTKGFEGVAGYDKITIKDQARRAAKLMENMDDARAVVRGEKPLPKGLRGSALITALEEQIKKTGDGQLAYELANSPLVSETSAAAQEMRLLAERQPDSVAARLHDLRKARLEAAKKRFKDLKKASKNEVGKIKKTIRAPSKYNWQTFINSIEC